MQAGDRTASRWENRPQIHTFSPAQAAGCFQGSVLASTVPPLGETVYTQTHTDMFIQHIKRMAHTHRLRTHRVLQIHMAHTLTQTQHIYLILYYMHHI